MTAMTLDSTLAALRASPPLAPYVDAIAALIRPTIRIVPRKARAADRAVGASRLGGDPDLPESIAWPEDEGERIDFVGQINLSDVAGLDPARRLPPAGLLLFFCRWTDRGEWVSRVVHATGALATQRNARRGISGVDFVADFALPPPSSRFVARADRSEWVYDARTNTTGRPPTVVELPGDAHAAYGDLYEPWLDAAGPFQHGMFGYDRAMEGCLRADEALLLRLDQDRDVPHDHFEACTLYFLLAHDALARGDFAAATAYYGASI